jgi:hypothetical protein
MASSGILRRVALVRTDVLDELSASIIRVTGSVRRLLVTANIVPSSPIFVTLMLEAIIYCETSLLTRATRRNIREDDILNCFSVVSSLSPHALPPPVFCIGCVRSFISDLS